MKKTWRRKRSPISIPPFFILAAVIFFSGWAAVAAIQNISPGALERVFGGFTAVRGEVGGAASSLTAFFSDKEELQEKIARLEDERLDLSLRLQISDYIAQENKELRNILSFTGGEGVLGSVIAWPPKTAYDTLLIRVGQEVALGDLVLGRGVVPIGLVTKVEGSYAYVQLFTQGGVATQVRVGADEIPLELTGRGGGSAVIIAPNDVPAEVGDSVFFPHNGNTLMGTIGAVETSPAAPVRALWLSFPKHFYAYTWVTVVPYTTL